MIAFSDIRQSCGLIYKLLFILVFLKCIAYPETNFLISNYDFTNQDYTWCDYTNIFTNWKNNKLTYAEKEIIFRVSRIFKIEVYVLLAKIQQESDLIYNLGGDDRYQWRYNRAVGYWMIRQWREDGVKFWLYSGYYVQVWQAGQRLRQLYDEHRAGMILTLGTGHTVKPYNAATYTLYRYTPYYGVHRTYGYDSRGNELFILIYKKTKALK